MSTTTSETPDRNTKPGRNTEPGYSGKSGRDAKPTLRYAAAKVPEIGIVFWVLKLISTGMGEAMSDALGDRSVPLAAAVGIFGMTLAIWLQLRQNRYRAGYYWFAVMMVAVFGTMAADGIHDGLGTSYYVTTPAFALITALIFWRWHHSEGTLSIHSIDTRRRERFYWSAVLGTFACGTAAGDLTGMQLNWGFWPSAAFFAAAIAIPAVGWARFRWNPILSFWFAYVITRPLGASFADGFSKNTNGGLNLGDPLVSLIAFVVFAAIVARMAVTGHDIQTPASVSAHPHLPHVELGMHGPDAAELEPAD